MVKINNLILVLSTIFLVGLVFAGKVLAVCSQGQQACSGTYGVGEVFYGSGGSLDTTCSSSYCAKQAVGETGVGLTSGSSYQAYSGFNVDREPSLQFIVNTSSIDFGTLSTGSTATSTATFSVKSYLSSGYSVVTVSAAPSDGSHTMSALTSPTASASGTEQFGINLVANTTPSVGASPVQIPSSSFSFGCAGNSCSTNNYNQANKFTYNNGDVIASSASSSGETDYTIAYICNISSVTPAGVYTMNQQLVATPTF